MMHVNDDKKKSKYFPRTEIIIRVGMPPSRYRARSKMASPNYNNISPPIIQERILYYSKLKIGTYYYGFIIVIHIE